VKVAGNKKGPGSVLGYSVRLGIYR